MSIIAEVVKAEIPIGPGLVDKVFQCRPEGAVLQFGIVKQNYDAIREEGLFFADHFLYDFDHLAPGMKGDAFGGPGTPLDIPAKDVVAVCGECIGGFASVGNIVARKTIEPEEIPARQSRKVIAEQQAVPVPVKIGQDGLRVAEILPVMSFGMGKTMVSGFDQGIGDILMKEHPAILIAVDILADQEYVDEQVVLLTKLIYFFAAGTGAIVKGQVDRIGSDRLFWIEDGMRRRGQ